MGAVGEEVITKVVGYKLDTFNSATSSPNLPQRVALFGEANYANQATLDTTPYQITSAQQAGDRYGYGSPIYSVARILFPASGGGIGNIPVVVYPQAQAAEATSKIVRIVATGTATGNGTHTIVIAGRNGLDAVFYDINVEEGDTTADISDKIETAVSAVLGSPVTSTSFDYHAQLETKWRGKTANDLVVSVNTNGDALGLSYAVTTTQTGNATPSIAAALAAFGNTWNTIVINTYGTVTNIMDALEEFNGKPSATNPTGRFASTIMKPFVALTGSTSADPSSITDTRLNDVTIAICPAPNSAAFPFEAAANMAVLYARKAQDTPELDVSGEFYPDMPTPADGNIGVMATLADRDRIVKKGCSTVDLVAGQYKVQDFVTTYHKTGVNPVQFRYVRNLYCVDMNVYYSYNLLVETDVVDHVIVNDNDFVSDLNVIKPKMFRQLILATIADLVQRKLLVDAAFTAENLIVRISTTNPDRFEVSFRYKRSGIARIVSTTAQAGFNLGTLTV